MNSLTLFQSPKNTHNNNYNNISFDLKKLKGFKFTIRKNLPRSVKISKIISEKAIIKEIISLDLDKISDLT